MKKHLLVLISVCLILSLSLVLLAACDDNSSNETPNSSTPSSDIDSDVNKQIPIYQGMTISSNVEANSSSDVDEWDNGKFSIDNPVDGYKGGHWEQDGDEQVWVDKHGNKYWRKEDGKLHHKHHPGCQHGDYEGKEDEIDTQEVVDEQTEIIDEQIEASLSVIGSAQEIYYASINQDIYITIKISNPDSYEILSFVLNGNKYTSYMFEDGSDLENLILKVNVGAIAGIKEYTIDEIKYIDGTEIKDVLMNGDKTVKAGVYADNMVSATISNESSTLTSISYDVNALDNYSLIEKSSGFIKSYLYDGNNVIEKELVLGKNSIIFDNLTPNTLYTFANIAYYDDLTGEGAAVNILSTGALYTKTIVLFDDIEKTQTSISWDYVWDNSVINKDIIKLEVYKDDVKVEDLDVTAKIVDELLSNNQYEIRATYKNVKDEEESISIFVTTLAKAVPTIEITNTSSTQTSIAFETSVVDEDSVGLITKIELNGVEQELTLREYTGLLSNNEYTIKVTYTYDLNNGKGKQIVVVEKKVTTLAKAEPIISVINDTITDNSIIATIDVTDVDSICAIEEVSIYKGDSLIETNAQKEINFDELTSYTNYQVKIKYTFNLNDGVGKQEKVFVKEYTTKPYISVSSCKVANTSAVSEGDIIYLQASIKNPNKVNCESVVVNGVEYGVASVTTTTQVFIYIEYNGQFAGGDTTLTIEKINYSIGGINYSTIVTTNNTTNVFINGKIEVVSIDYVDENYNKIDWCFPDDTVYLLLTLNNPTGYDVEKITYYHKVTTATYDYVVNKIDNNHYTINTSLDYYCNSFKANMLSYKNDDIDKVLDFDKITTSIFKLNDNDVHYVQTADDLLNMNGGYYYELTNDIDLSGKEWSNPGNMMGIFDGNGYNIKNMSFVGTVVDKAANLGLFGTCNGIIKNLNIVKATFIVDIQNTNMTNFYGSICSQCSQGYVENCTVDQDSIVSVKGYVSVGGICGSNANTINCINMGSLSLEGQGSVYGLSSGKQFNCINAGDLKGVFIQGHLGGYVVGITSLSENSINTGTLYGEGVRDSSCIYGYSSNSTNCYSINDGTCTVEQLNDASFYIDTLGWDEDIWDFSDLDIENGKYPKLK